MAETKAKRAADTDASPDSNVLGAGVDLNDYRPNVGVVLFDAQGQVWLGQRVGETGLGAWQFPQGGIDEGEDPAAAALRELREETGVTADLVSPLGRIEHWLVYHFPPEVRERKRKRNRRDWHGQKQLWFAFRFHGTDEDVDLAADDQIEFDDWRWEALSRTPDTVIAWKRPVYHEIVAAFSTFAAPVFE